MKKCNDKQSNLGYEKLLQSIYDAVFITTDEGTIIDFNERAIETFRAESSQLSGISILDLLSGANPSLIVAVLQNLQDHRYTVIEARCRRYDGTLFHGEIAVNCIDLHGHGELCFLVRDISVKYKAQQDLQHALERVEAISRSRMEFVSNVSHELRTPLTSMIYAVKNMQNGHAGILSERAMQYLARLDSDCKRLLGTVNDILDIRQLENNTLVLVKKRTPICRIVSDAVETLRVQADAKQLTLTYKKKPSYSFVNCDPARTERVFINIIGNALKFTPSGGEISVDCDYDGDNKDKVVIKIADTGVGIPQQMLSKVTMRYVQVGDQPAGTGLGLAITKELIEMHGGSLSIESPVPGKDSGTLVTVTFPTVPPPNALILSKDADLAEKLKNICNDCGISAETISGGHSAIRKAVETPPDLLILCNETDDLASCDIAVQFRNDRRLNRIPILFLKDENTSQNILTVIGAFKIPSLNARTSNQDLITEILSLL